MSKCATKQKLYKGYTNKQPVQFGDLIFEAGTLILHSQIIHTDEDGLETVKYEMEFNRHYNSGAVYHGGCMK